MRNLGWVVVVATALAMMMCGCTSGPAPSVKPKIAGISYYSDPAPDTDRNIYFLSGITHGKGRYFDVSVAIEMHTMGTVNNETRELLNGTVPTNSYSFRCDLGNFTTMPDDVIIVRSAVEVWSEKGGRSLANASGEINFTCPRKTTDGVYLMIQSGTGVNMMAWNMGCYANMTLRNDGYRTADAANITMIFNDETGSLFSDQYYKWNNESIPPGETRAGGYHVANNNHFTLTVSYCNVSQDSGSYVIH